MAVSVLLCLMEWGTAAAAPLSERRAQVEALVAQILSGEAKQGARSRLRFLREGALTVHLLQAALPGTSPAQRRDVAEALAFLDAPEAEASLVLLTRDRDPVVRMSAAQGLGRLKSQQVQALRPLLADPTLGVRREAARALGRSGDKRQGAVLMAAAHRETTLEARTAMLVAVGDSRDFKQRKALAAYLQSESELTRLAAAQGLCRLGAPEGLRFAGRLLASPDRFVRREGVALYEGSRASVAAPALRPLLKDPDRPLSAQAARILFQGGEETMLDWLVLASWQAKDEDKLAYEAELETLQLQDDQRRAILRRHRVTP